MFNMARCLLCNDQEKRKESDPCLLFHFTIEELAFSAYEEGCDSCVLIFEGIRQFQAANWSCQRSIRYVDGRCRSSIPGTSETLSLNVYFYDNSPKLELELFTLQSYCKFDISLFWLGGDGRNHMTNKRCLTELESVSLLYFC